MPSDFQNGDDDDDDQHGKQSSSLSVVTSNGLAASTSSIAPLEYAPQSKSPQVSPSTADPSLDFIGSSTAVKKLFSMSLDTLSHNTQQQQQVQQEQQQNKKKPTLLAVHNFDGTLIIDDAEDESSYEFFQQSNTQHRQEENGYTFYRDNTQSSSTTLLPPSSQSLALALSPASQSSSTARDAVSMLSTIVQQQQQSTNSDEIDSNLPNQEQSSALLAPPKAPREYVQWKFQDLNMLLGHDALVVRPPEGSSEGGGDGIAVRVEDVQFLKSVWETFQQQQLQQKPLLKNEENSLSYAQALLQDRETELSKTTSAVVSVKDNDDTPTDSSSPEKQESSESDVALQTCIVPFLGPLGSKLSPLEESTPSPISNDPATPATIDSEPSTSPALSIVLDAYLDNLMANVPQLALCLEEKGLIQSVKMLPTEEIPSMMLNPSTLDTSRPLDVLSSRSNATPNTSDASRSRHHRRLSKLEESIFSPQMMETNASALLRFLKTNCTRNHATYLLRHEALDSGGNSSSSPHNIQLYDISSISTQKQKKWIWWLATMSYRFALRLRHLETAPGKMLSESQKRAIRDRQRSLFQQTLDLLQDLMDIDGNAHESMVASVREHMADTYLSSSGNNAEESSADPSSEADSPRKRSSDVSASPPVVTASISTNTTNGTQSSQLASFIVQQKLPKSEHVPSPNNESPSDTNDHQHQQPYADVTADALNKAQDHLVRGIKTLSNLYERDIEEQRRQKENKERREEEALKRSRRRQRSERRVDPNIDEEKIDDEKLPLLSPAMVLQLFGMNFKLVNISLRLAEHHLGNYYSSSAMQALRAAARRLNDAARLLDYCNSKRKGKRPTEEDSKRQESLQLQYIWLLEHCGHFARSFASDELWRDRGHASGDDVIFVLADVEAVFDDSFQEVGTEKTTNHFWEMVKMDSLLKKSEGKISLQSLSGVVAPFETKANQIENAIEAARAVLGKENLLRRERRKVLVASCILYSRAITAFQFTVQQWDQPVPEKMVLLNLLRQRLGDACNETGKVLLAALRNLLVNHQGSKKTSESQLAAEALLDSAEFWFNVGLEAFDACRDTRNLALLRCNLCQSYKLRANSGFSKRENNSSSPKHAEECLQQAADQLLTAHVDLGVRDTHPQTWDMVSEELAATFLVLGVRRRQSLLGSGNAPVIFQLMRLSPGEERSIVDPMERALKIYEQSDNAHQAAAVHYQLALTYSKLWTCQLNETNTRKKLSKAFEHYKTAFNYFSAHSRGNEPTFCLLCLDLASLYAAIPGEEGLMKSLGCCLDCCDTFSAEAIKAGSSISSNAKLKAEWFEKMETIAQSVDDRVFKLLRSLVKANPDRYKDMYREGLTAKMVRNVPSEEHEENSKSAPLLALHEVLLAVKKMYGVIVLK